MTQAITTFFAAWSVTDAEKRHAAIASVFAEDASYADPRTPAPLVGPTAVSEYIGMFVDAAPGATAKPVKIDTQADVTRTTIEFQMADGMVQHGQYFVEHAKGQIARMVGFVGTGIPE